MGAIGPIELCCILKSDPDVGKLILCVDEGARYTAVSTAWLCFMRFAL